MEFESVLRSSRHSDLLLYRALRNYRSVEEGRTYVARVWDRKGLADVERDRLVELLGTMVERQRSLLLVQIYDALVDDRGRLVVVQEHVPGGSFRRVYRSYRFRVDEVLALGVQLAGALVVLHRHMPHRRVDPSTVLFRHGFDNDYGRHVAGPVLAGVEVAEVAGSAGWGPWRSGWASHGVRSGDGAGGRSDDLYSVAALMCSALTRDKPPSYAGKLADPLRPDVPNSLQQLLRLTMDTDPRRRPSSAEELVHELWAIEDECRLSRTGIDRVRPAASDGVRRSGSSGDLEPSHGEPQPGFGAPRGPVVLPPPPATPGPAAPSPAGDPPGGPFPRLGRRSP